jgi:large subunit ribosomal protein L18
VYLCRLLRKKKQALLRRKKHVKKSISGSSDRPRLTVFRSGKHIYAQVIDDMAGVTLASASTLSKSLKDDIKNGSNKVAAEKVGAAVAKEALNVGIKCVKFDRNGYLFHGRVKALADSARKEGLVF